MNWGDIYMIVQRKSTTELPQARFVLYSGKLFKSFLSESAIFVPMCIFFYFLLIEKEKGKTSGTGVNTTSPVLIFVFLSDGLDFTYFRVFEKIRPGTSSDGIFYYKTAWSI